VSKDRESEIQDVTAEIAYLHHYLSELRHRPSDDEINDAQITNHYLEQLSALSAREVQARRGVLIDALRVMEVRWADIAEALEMTQQGAQKIYNAHQRLRKRRKAR